jgi:4-amino-4-deoxy-L-arabinose transferase-like glycosyltransferase
MGTRPLFLTIIAICFCLYLVNLGARDFWAPDEGDFAQIASELATNHLVPHLNNKPYGEKPPLFYYVTLASEKVLFWATNETSARVPSVLFAILSALLFFFTIFRHYGRQHAFFSTFMLISAPLYYWQARYLQVDMVFASLVGASLLSFLHYHTGKRESFLYLTFLAAGLAFMTKGPLALILILPVIVIYLLSERDGKILRTRGLWVGSLVFLAVVIPWYAAVYMKEGMPYLYENIVRQNLTRFFDAWSHKRPVYYYLTTLPLDFFPWSLFLPMGFYLVFRSIRTDPRLKFFFIWFAWMFFFLSLSSGKISKYMLPALPALSLIASLPLAGDRNGYNRIVFRVLSLVFVAVGALLLCYRTALYPEFYPVRVLCGGLSLVLAFLLFCLTKINKPSSAFLALFSFLVAIYMVANVAVYPKWNLYKSSRALCGQIKTYVEGGRSWVYYGSMRGVYVYYVGSFAIQVDEHKTDELKKLAERSDDFYILTRKRDVGEIRDALGKVKLIIEEKVGDTTMVFVHFKRNV